MAQLQPIPRPAITRRAQPAIVDVRLVRAIHMGGRRLDVGEVLQLARAFAAELIGSGKAVHHTAPAVQHVPPASIGDAKAQARKPTAPTQPTRELLDA